MICSIVDFRAFLSLVFVQTLSEWKLETTPFFKYPTTVTLNIKTYIYSRFLLKSVQIQFYFLDILFIDTIHLLSQSILFFSFCNSLLHCRLQV